MLSLRNKKKISLNYRQYPSNMYLIIWSSDRLFFPRKSFILHFGQFQAKKSCFVEFIFGKKYCNCQVKKYFRFTLDIFFILTDIYSFVSLLFIIIF